MTRLPDRWLDNLFDNRSDPVSRAVLDDAHLDRGIKPTRLGTALDYIRAADAADADADAADADAADADPADPAADAADAAAADADAADADAADAAADAARGRVRRVNHFTLLTQEPSVEPGLKIIMLPGAYYYGVTRLGWLERVNGDEFVLHAGARNIRLIGEGLGLDGLAARGLVKGRYEFFGEPDGAPEHVHRLTIRRCLPTDPKVWGKACPPKPAGWDERHGKSEAA